MSIIQRLTKDCPRQDCNIIHGMGTSTCMGWFPSFDRNGNIIGGGDPNIHITRYDCSACDRIWSVRTQYGDTTVQRKDTERVDKPKEN